MKLYLSSYRVTGEAPELRKMLCGDAPIVAYVPNALDGPADGHRRNACIDEDLEQLRGMGLRVFTLDLRDYFNQPHRLKKLIRKCDCLFVRGGNSFVLRRAYRESGLEDILQGLITNEEIVYAAYSAGIDPLTPTLRGAELVDDPTDVPDGYPAEPVWEGLGILPYVVAPHFRSNHPESRDIERSVEYLIDHHTPFIALRDGQAIVIDGSLADQRIRRVA